MRFRFIDRHRGTFPVRVMCEVLEVSPAGYYAWRGRPESGRTAANRDLLGEIRRVHLGSRGRYGSPRVHAVLRAEGVRVGRHRVADLMRRHGIAARRARRGRLAPPTAGTLSRPPPTCCGGSSRRARRTKSGSPI